MLRDHRGEIFEFYSEVTGGPVVIVFVKAGDARNADIVAAFNRRLDDFDSFGADLFVVREGNAGSLAESKQRNDSQIPFVADVDGSVSRWYLSQGDTKAPAAFVLDPNQRVLSVERLKSGGGTCDDMAERALICARESMPQRDPRVLKAIPPVLTLPNMLSPEDCATLIDHWRANDKHHGRIRTGSAEGDIAKVDGTIKRRADVLISDQALELQLIKKLMPRVGEEVFKAFQFDNWHFEKFRLGGYDHADAGFFRAHRDNYNKMAKNRRFALSLLLNDDYTGGELRFPEYSIDGIHPPAGSAVLFSCSLLHEVKPVTVGYRFVLLSFLIDSKAAAS